MKRTISNVNNGSKAVPAPPSKRSANLTDRDYKPVSPPCPAASDAEEPFSLPSLQQFKVEPLPHHQAQNIGGNQMNRGHRVTGPLTDLVYQFLNEKYLRFYGYLDGLLRFRALKAEGAAAVMLDRYFSQVFALVKEKHSLDDMHPLKWENGKYSSLFQIINNINRRRDDIDCLLNDLNLIKALKPTHPRHREALQYMRHFESGLFNGVSRFLQKIIKQLASDVREYDTQIQLKDRADGYKKISGFFANITEVLEKKRSPGPVVRVATLELHYDSAALLKFCKENRLDTLYVENLRVLYHSVNYTKLDFTPGGLPISEKYYSSVYHEYIRVGASAHFATNCQSEALDFINSNLAIMEVHLRPKFGKFFLDLRRVNKGDNAFQATLTIDSTKQTYTAVTTIFRRCDQITYLGFIVDGKFTVTDIIRIDDRECSADLTRASYDRDDPDDSIAVFNIDIKNPAENSDCYDLFVRCESGVYRARSLFNFRVYDKTSWLRDYLEIIGCDNFERLYDVKELRLARLITVLKQHVRDRLPRTQQRLSDDFSEDLILTLDGRYHPPLIVSAKFDPAKKTTQYQGINAKTSPLNKYYILAKASASWVSLDSPPVLFPDEYEDEIFRYKTSDFSPQVNEFARFPSDVEDELYYNGKHDYRRYIQFAKAAEEVSLHLDEDAISKVEVYQPFHSNMEEQLLTQMRDLKIENLKKHASKRNQYEKRKNRDGQNKASQ